MVGAPPLLWGWLTKQWCPLPSALAWVWWRGLLHAQWSTAVTWRQQFIAFEQPDQVLSRDLVEAFLRQIAQPHQLMALVEALLDEKRLLRRDAHQLEEQILRHVTRDGTWKHQAQGERHGRETTGAGRPGYGGG